MFVKFIVLSVSILALSSCTQKKSAGSGEKADEVSSAVAQTMEELAGQGSFCEVVSSLGNPRAVLHSLTLGVDRSYNYNLFISNSQTCATPTSTGGDNIATYNQFGIYSLDGAADIGGLGTKVYFTVSAGSLTIFAQGSLDGQDLALWMNTCDPIPNFTTNIDNNQILSGNVCLASAGFSALTFPSIGARYSNVLYRDGASLSMGHSETQTIFNPAGVSFPTSFAHSYLDWN